MKHQPSDELAGAIRGLGIDLVNEHAMLQPAQRITTLLQELFVEVLEVAEKLEEDGPPSRASFREQRTQKKTTQNGPGRSRTRPIFGVLMMKNKLRVSPDGIQWKGHNFPLGSVTRVRWGGVRNSV